MKLSTRGRYGIHAMYDLARYHQSEPQSIKAIAERQNIPEAYLEQLIAVLRRSGLVTSVRGAQGGYLLARPPGEITVGQVLRALEGDLALVDCLVEEDACAFQEQDSHEQYHFYGLDETNRADLFSLEQRYVP